MRCATLSFINLFVYFSGGRPKQVFLDLGKNNIGDLLAIIYHSTSCVAALNAANFCELVTDGDAPPTNTFQFPGP